MIRRVRRIGSEAQKIRVSVRVRKALLGPPGAPGSSAPPDSTTSSLKNISVVFERGGKQVATSSRNATVNESTRQLELDYNGEDLVLTVTLYQIQAEDGAGNRLAYHEKTGRLIIRQSKGRGGVSGKEAFQELGVVTLMLHQICALQCSSSEHSTQSYTLPVTKIGIPGSVIEIDVTAIKVQSLQIDDGMSDVSEHSGYSDVSSQSQKSAKSGTGGGMFARLGLGSSGVGAVSARASSGNSSSSSSSAAGGGSVSVGVANEVDALQSKVAILQMNLDRAVADRDNLEAVQAETQKELALALAQKSSPTPPPSPRPKEEEPANTANTSVELEILRVEVKRLTQTLLEVDSSRQALVSQVSAALMQAQQEKDDKDAALRSAEEAAAALALLKQEKEKEAVQKSDPKGESARLKSAIAALESDKLTLTQNADSLRLKVEELQRKEKVTESFILDKTRRLSQQAKEERSEIEKQLQQARAQLLTFAASSEKQSVLAQENERLEARLAEALADLQNERILMEDRQRVNQGLMEDLSRKDALHKKLEIDYQALRESMAALQETHADELYKREQHVSELSHSGADVEARCAQRLAEQAQAHSAQQELHHQHIARLQSETAEATGQLYAQLAEKDRVHGQTLRALQAQLESAAKERHTEKEALTLTLTLSQASSAESISQLRTQLSMLEQENSVFVANLIQDVERLNQQVAQLRAEKETHIGQISALEATGSESTARLSARLSELQDTHAVELKTLQAQLSALSSGHASERASLLQQLSAAELAKMHITDGHAEEVSRVRAETVSVQEQLDAALVEAKHAWEEAQTKVEFLETCLKQERRVERDLREALESSKAAHAAEVEAHQNHVAALQSQMTQLRTSLDKDEQHSQELELMQISAREREASYSAEVQSVKTELLSTQEESHRLQLELAEKQHLLEALTAQHNSLQAHIAETQAAHAAAVADVEQQQQQLTLQRQDLETQLELLKSQLEAEAAAQTESFQSQLEAANNEIAALRLMLAEGEAAVRSVVAENNEYVSRNETLQAQQTILSLESMEKDTSAASWRLQEAALRLQLAQQREERATMEAALKAQISELSEAVQAHSVIQLEASLGLEREREGSQLESLSAAFIEKERERERWGHEATIASAQEEIAHLRAELREREIELEHTASALAKSLAAATAAAKGRGKGGRGKKSRESGVVGSQEGDAERDERRRARAARKENAKTADTATADAATADAATAAAATAAQNAAPPAPAPAAPARTPPAALSVDDPPPDYSEVAGTTAGGATSQPLPPPDNTQRRGEREKGGEPEYDSCSDTESSTDDSMQGQGEVEYVQEKLDAANDALRHMSSLIDAERLKNMTIRHCLMRFSRQFTQADTELLLQAGVILEQQAPAR